MKLSPPVVGVILVVAIALLIFSLMKSGIVAPHGNIPTGPPASAMGAMHGGAAPAGAATAKQ